jgi:hypothetical protein
MFVSVRPWRCGLQRREPEWGPLTRYERGLRYNAQRVRVGLCGCGRPATALVDVGRGVVGWRCLMPSCAACTTHRYLVTFDSFADRPGGLVPVIPDDSAASWPGPITAAPCPAAQICG